MKCLIERAVSLLAVVSVCREKGLREWFVPNKMRVSSFFIS